MTLACPNCGASRPSGTSSVGDCPQCGEETPIGSLTLGRGGNDVVFDGLPKHFREDLYYGVWAVNFRSGYFPTAPAGARNNSLLLVVTIL
jgi:hypothetical protein